jgi:hypothetical protein
VVAGASPSAGVVRARAAVIPPRAPSRWAAPGRTGADSRVRVVLAALVVAATTAACSQRVAYVHPALQPATAPAHIDYRLVLIGDAGEPKDPEPVLTAARDWASRLPGRTAVVYLGDNAYPRGFIERRLADAEARVARQIDAVHGVGAEIVFLPGNHDWDKSDKDGLLAIRRQAAFVNGRGATFRPAPGCAGPEVLDLPAGAPAVRVVFLDTQWWLHRWSRADGCAAPTPPDIVAALSRALETPLPVVVTGHHPIATHGPHGGFYDWRAHFFPLGDLWRWARRLPLPVVGSLYPITRTLLRSRQDLGDRTNRLMRDALASALAGATQPALKVYAAGHEHSLQVLTHDAVDYALVSGAGSSDHKSPVARRSDTLFALSGSGFMVLDVVPDGVRLTVVNRSAEAGTPAVSFRLSRRPAA